MMRGNCWFVLSLLLVLGACGVVDGEENSPVSFVQGSSSAEVEVKAEENMELQADKAAAEYEEFEQDQLDGEQREEMDETKEFMQEADLNKDGKISREELHQLAERDAANMAEQFDGAEDGELLAAGKDELAVDKSKTTGFFAKADRDKDGFVDAKELPALMQLMNEAQEDGSQVSLVQETAETSEEAEDTANAEGELEDESEHALEEKAEMAEGDEFMREADLNKDGKISLEELHKLAESNAADLMENFNGTDPEDVLAVGKEELEADKSNMAGFLAAADHNKNGFVDAKELPALLQAMDEADVKETADEEHELQKALV